MSAKAGNKKRKHDPNKPIMWEEVFIPYGYPEHTFITRGREAEIKIITDFLTSPRELRVLCIQGPSQSGKTNLMEHVLRQVNNVKAVKLSGSDIKDKKGFIDKLCLRLEQDERTIEQGGELKTSFIGVFRRITRRRQVSDTHILHALDRSVLIIDDFHRIPSQGQREIFDWFKEQSERSELVNQKLDVRFCVIFIPNKSSISRSTIGELKDERLVPVKLKLWDTNQLVRISQDYIQDAAGNLMLGLTGMAEAAQGLPSLMQLLCLKYCKQYHENAIPGTTILAHDQQLLTVIQDTADERWSSFTYQQLTAQNMGTQTESQQFVSRDKKLSGSVYQMIWYVLSAPKVPKEEQKLLLPLQYKESVEVPLVILQQRFERLLGKKIGLNDLRNHVDFMARNAELQYRKSIEKEVIEDDPLFELVGDRIIIYSPRILFELSFSHFHLEELQQNIHLGKIVDE